MSTTDFNRISEVLVGFLDKEAEEIAGTTGFVVRNSKLSGAVFAQTLILGWLADPDAPLSGLVQWSARLGVDLSESGLHQRMNEQAVSFMVSLLERGLHFVQTRVAVKSEILSRFAGVYLLDSSLITLPSSLSDLFAGSGRQGSAAALKVQLSYEYQAGQLQALQLEAGRSPDQKCELAQLAAQPNSLHLFDLGYFVLATFVALAQAGAFFVSRLQLQTALYFQPEDQQALDLLSLLASQSASCGELNLFMGRDSRLPVRLIFQKLPPAVVQERRRKARAKARQRGQTPSKQRLALLAYALFISNVPADWLAPRQIVELYRLRWQVELIFKLWKSQAHLDHIHARRPERVLCQCLARLLGLLLFHTFIAPWRFLDKVQLSPPKAWRILQSYILPLVLALAQHASTHLAPVLAAMSHDFLRFALTSSRKKSPSTFVRLRALGLA